jgi:hypothetical protein
LAHAALKDYFVVQVPVYSGLGLKNLWHEVDTKEIVEAGILDEKLCDYT